MDTDTKNKNQVWAAQQHRPTGAGWKFWTWAGQIRQLKRQLKVANEDFAHLMATVGRLQEQLEHSRRQHRNVKH